MVSFSDAVTGDATGVTISLEVSPSSNRPGFFTGYDPWRRSLRCAVSSPPTQGKANREVVETLAETLGVPAASVTILSGATRSRKRVRVEGIDRETVIGRLSRLLTMG